MPRAEKRGAFNIDNYYSSTSPSVNQFVENINSKITL